MQDVNGQRKPGGGRLIDNCYFEGVAPLEPGKKLVSVCPGWLLHATKSDLVRASNSAEGKGLKLSWEADCQRVRLLHRLVIDPSLHGSNLNVHFALDGATALQDVVEWVALLSGDESAGFKFIERLDVATGRLKGVINATAFAPMPAMETSQDIYFGIQFQPSARTCSLVTASLNVSARVVSMQRPAEAPAASVDLRTVALVPAPTQPLTQKIQPTKSPVQPSATLSTPPSPASANRASRKKRVAVISWDMAHNPVGRAYLLADMLRNQFDVELIGPIFSRYGNAVWKPLAKPSVRVRTFKATNARDFMAGAIDLVQSIDCDVVYVSKARLPGMLLGMLLKQRLKCPVVLDVDDHELAFFGGAPPLSIEAAFQNDNAAALDPPFELVGTRMAESLVSTFDGLTVSNVALQRKFGGVIVRHARDEAVFRPRDSVRSRTRAEFGLNSDDKAILFLGTPRRHKGIIRIVQALERLNDQNLCLVVVGSINDPTLKEELATYKRARIKLFEDQPWDKLADIVSLADAVCLLQDPKSDVSAYQIPAKLTDALALGIPVIATGVQPLDDIATADAIHTTYSDRQLDELLRAVATGEIAPGGMASRERRFFTQELSYGVNFGRLACVLNDAMAQPSSWNSKWTEVLDGVSRAYSTALPASPPTWARERINRPAVKRGGKFDLAFFWKQNDTGIYGRRHDMLMKHLARHERVGRVTQFDAPIALKQLEDLSAGSGSQLDQSRFVAESTIRRFLEARDEARFNRRTFVFDDDKASHGFLGRPLPRRSGYVDYVMECLDRNGSSNPLIGWCFPIVFDFPEIARNAQFSLTVTDLIDDQRPMSQSSGYREKLDASYRATIGLSDLVLTNCQPVADAFSELAKDIHVLPNACEIINPERTWEKPVELAGLKGPILGYTGNLRDRLDVELLERISDERPDWQIVLIGSAHGEPDILRLRGRENVHFLGVRPYEEAQAYISHFDVAIMPHVDNEVSQRMNPLKLYVYHALGVPIVSTDVANIEEIAPYSRIARTGEEFIAEIEGILAAQVNRPRRRPDSEALKPISWDDRIERILKLVDDVSA